MQKINLYNKKIGIWGLGIVGKSVLGYVQKFTNQIQIMDQNPANASIIQETQENIAQFLQHNDIIIPSPGIILYHYKNYAHKFVQELDIFAQEFHGTTIAITGTVGKTTITSLLAQCIPNSVAAGNIGHPMLHTLKELTVILELSSYQLQYAQNFAPDLAIWTNFYPNHLDHHQNEQEYFVAKCNMLKYQTKYQTTLLPYNLIDKIKQYITPQAQIYLFSEKQNYHAKHPTFFIDKNQLLLHQNNQIILVLDQLDQLPDITFTQNWIIILAAMYLQKISLQQFATLTKTLKPQEHRLEFVKNLNDVQIYNDSKSTVWQATQSAVDKFDNKRLALFLGGMSKGTDRTPLIQHLQHKNITVFTFGKESETLANLCTNFQIPHWSASTLQEALTQYLTQQKNFDILLFSPAGSSFDLFKNFEDRGTQFKKMINSIDT